MFRQIVKLTVVSVIWKRYKGAILSTVALFAYYWFVEKVHADYLNYLNLQQTDNNLGISFILKWLLLAGGFVSYCLFNFYRKIPNNKSLPDDGSQEKSRDIRKRKKTMSEKQGPETEGPDPFSNIRDKKSLRSKADIVLEKNKKT